MFKVDCPAQGNSHGKLKLKMMIKATIKGQIQVGKDIEKFLIVSSEDLEDRMDVDVWVEKIKEMENVEITECSYNMEALLGK